MQSTMSRRAFVTGLAMFSMPLIALAQDKDKEKEKEEKKKKAEDKKDEAKDKAEDGSMTRTKSSMAPAPITLRTAGRIDAATRRRNRHQTGSPISSRFFGVISLAIDCVRIR